MRPESQIQAIAHDPPSRIPERELAAVVGAAAAATCSDGQDRAVVFDARRRAVRIETWPADDRPGLTHIADITCETTT